MQKRDKKVKPDDRVNMHGLKPDDRQNPKEKKRTEPLRDARAQCDEEIHLFRRMMRAMRRPQNIDLVSPSMHPVKNEIDAEKQQNRTPPIDGNRKNSKIFPQPAVNEKDGDHHENIRRLIAELRPEIRDRFVKCDQFLFENKTGGDFQNDKDQRDRRNIKVNVCFLHGFFSGAENTANIMQNRRELQKTVGFKKETDRSPMLTDSRLLRTCCHVLFLLIGQCNSHLFKRNCV